MTDETKRADAVAADPSPRMVTGYCQYCADGIPVTESGSHFILDNDGNSWGVPCTGEHAPGLQARPTQYCFWCSIGSPTDERGQHHVDGDAHQCTGQRVPQANPAEAGDEVARLTAERDAARAELAQARKQLEQWPLKWQATMDDYSSLLADACASSAQARREAERLREALRQISNCDRDDWIEHESMIDHIYHIAREALEAK